MAELVRLITDIQLHILTCTSAASPAPAPRRDEAFLFSNCKKGRNKNKKTITRRTNRRGKNNLLIPFLGGLELHVWGTAGGWAYTSGSCQLSFFGFHQWKAAAVKHGAEVTLPSLMRIHIYNSPLIRANEKAFFLSRLLMFNWPLLWACRTSERPDSTSPPLCCARFSWGSLEPCDNASAYYWCSNIT